MWRGDQRDSDARCVNPFAAKVGEEAEEENEGVFEARSSNPSGAVVDVERVEELTCVTAAGTLGEGRCSLGPCGGRTLGAARRRCPGQTATPSTAATALDAQRRLCFPSAAPAAATAAFQMHVRYAGT